MLFEIKVAVVVFFAPLAILALIAAMLPWKRQPRPGEICEDTCEKLRKEWLLKSCGELAVLGAEIHNADTMDA